MGPCDCGSPADRVGPRPPGEQIRWKGGPGWPQTGRDAIGETGWRLELGAAPPDPTCSYACRVRFSGLVRPNRNRRRSRARRTRPLHRGLDLPRGGHPRRLPRRAGPHRHAGHRPAGRTRHGPGRRLRHMAGGLVARGTVAAGRNHRRYQQLLLVRPARRSGPPVRPRPPHAGRIPATRKHCSTLQGRGPNKRHWESTKWV